MKENNNISQEQLETIERYINGTMASEELKAFELKLSSDSEFKTQVEDIRILLTGIETQSLKEQMDEFHNEISQSNLQPRDTKIRYLNIRKWAVAAVIILSAGGFWFFNQNPNEKLYSDHFYPDPGLPTTMSNSTNYDFYDAMVNYKQGEYKIALQKWEALDKKNDTVNYYIGVSHLALENQEKAITYLEKSLQNTQFGLANDAYFYLGLAHLKNNNRDLAKQNLKKSTLQDSKSLLSELED